MRANGAENINSKTVFERWPGIFRQMYLQNIDRYSSQAAYPLNQGQPSGECLGHRSVMQLPSVVYLRPTSYSILYTINNTTRSSQELIALLNPTAPQGIPKAKTVWPASFLMRAQAT